MSSFTSSTSLECTSNEAQIQIRPESIPVIAKPEAAHKRQETDESDNTPLGTLYPNAIIDISDPPNFSDIICSTPPPEYTSVPPPAYFQKRNRAKFLTLLRFCRYYITFDLFLNFFLVLNVAMVSFIKEGPMTPVIIPIVYILFGGLGKIAYEMESGNLMMIYSGTYFARLAGDISIAAYALMAGYTNYYTMSPFVLLISLPMMGIRWFLPVLFPCYNTEYASAYCDEQDYYDAYGVFNFYGLFCLILFPQILIGSFLLISAVRTTYKGPQAAESICDE